MAVTIEMQVEDRFEELDDFAYLAAERTLDLTSQELWGETRQEAPVDTGRLAGSFLLEKRSPFLHAVYTMVEYAWDVHERNPYGKRAVEQTEQRIDEFAQMVVDELIQEKRL